jgi:hypothetical protein
MHMIRAHFHLINADVVLLSNVRKEFLHPLLHLTLQHITTVLRRPDEVILSIVDGMGRSSEDHATILTPKLLLVAGIEPATKSAHSPPPQVAGQPERFSCYKAATRQSALPCVALSTHKAPLIESLVKQLYNHRSQTCSFNNPVVRKSCYEC